MEDTMNTIKILLAAGALSMISASAFGQDSKPWYEKYKGPNCGQYACVVAYGQHYRLKVLKDGGGETYVDLKDCQQMPKREKFEKLSSEGMIVFACRDHRGHAFFVHETKTPRKLLLSANTNLNTAIENAPGALAGILKSDDLFAGE